MGSIAESPSVGSCSTAQYLKQTSAIIDSTVQKNVNKQGVALKAQEDRSLQQIKGRQAELRRRTEEAEALKQKLLHKKQVQIEKLNEFDEEDEKLAPVLDAKIKEEKNRYESLKASGCSDFEYVSCFGSFVTQSFKLDWKTDLGKVKCPEGKTIVSDSKADKEECDFWNCPALQPIPDSQLTPTDDQAT